MQQSLLLNLFTAERGESRALGGGNLISSYFRSDSYFFAALRRLLRFITQDKNLLWI